MSDSASHSIGVELPDDRPLAETDLNLKIAAQIQHFFKYDLDALPLAVEGKILRVEVPLLQLDPLEWLARQPSDVKTYWADRHSAVVMAGVGQLQPIADTQPIDYATIFQRLRQNLSPLFPRVRYYGGISFSQEQQIDPSWQLFGNYRFIIPKFEIRRDGSETRFACNFVANLVTNSADRDRQLASILRELAQLDFNLTVKSSGSLPLLIDRIDLPNRHDWDRNIASALAIFASRQLDKIVLARQSILTFDDRLQPLSLLLALQPHNHHSYHFCFQIDPTTALIGTSPERLYQRDDRILNTEAIAGTRQRGASIQLDRQLGEDLRNSAKDLREHQFVVNNLQGILTALCDRVEIDPQFTILKLNKVQHLYTQCRGRLKPDLSDAQILPMLHPTPAVGGFPTAQALATIQQLEPFARGWYAAPVGWIGGNDAEFAVAIRSGAIDRHRLSLFAGAGIVRGSQAAAEWAEVETKIRHFTDLFVNKLSHEA